MTGKQQGTLNTTAAHVNSKTGTERLKLKWEERNGSNT